MLEIKGKWDSLWDAYIKSPEKITGANKPWDMHGELVRMQGDLLRKRLSDNDVRKLAANSESLPVHWRDWSKSDRAVVDFMLEVLVYSRDRENLVTLLSTRFPLRISNWPIEYYLAQNKVKQSCSDSRGGLCEVPSSRSAHDIAAAVRRAFGGLNHRE